MPDHGPLDRAPAIVGSKAGAASQAAAHIGTAIAWRRPPDDTSLSEHTSVDLVYSLLPDRFWQPAAEVAVRRGFLRE